ncbi:hypothetical protein M1K46_14200 [Fictibacillus sp. WQ 8-8]|uniref:hypothetical protein n=1 Tax=Fictibacillus sp. WQ 8-8 TaxID=2938788 RepID=UPI00210E9BDE|nr:hypothetical protein [Fictibacillus sp. WQ 8-8]MCQ6266805.1 hypothetical protein [Fictibacillus sp. WQ 8-8]
MKKTISRLPMPAGLRIELSRAAGLDNETLFRALKEKDVKALRPAGENLDWEYMFSYAEQHEEEVKVAIYHGYEFKFLTINGLRNYLKICFGFKDGHEFDVSEEGVFSLKINAEDVKELEGALPGHWNLSTLDVPEEKDGRRKIQIKPAALEQNKAAGS